MFGFKNLIVHHSDGDDVADFGLCQVETHTDEVTMLNPIMSGVDDNNDSTTAVVADTMMKMGMTFEDIVRGNHSTNSFVRVNPVIPSQKKHMYQKKQVARFILVWWNLY